MKKIIWFALLSLILLSIIVSYSVRKNKQINQVEITETTTLIETTIEKKVTPITPKPTEEATTEKPKKSNKEIAKEVLHGDWDVGDKRKELLTEAGYDYETIQSLVNDLIPKVEVKYCAASSSSSRTYSSSGTGRLTKSGGVYYNSSTGLKETWYSQRVLPGGGLRIPGRHVDSRGFVCDENGYICVAANSAQYSKGTIIETSNGTGKVYDCGCDYGIVDCYVDW